MESDPTKAYNQAATTGFIRLQRPALESRGEGAWGEEVNPYPKWTVRVEPDYDLAKENR